MPFHIGKCRKHRGNLDLRLFSQRNRFFTITAKRIIDASGDADYCHWAGILYEKAGAKLEHVVLSHVDRAKNFDDNLAVLDIGVWLEYDSAFRWKNDGPNYALQLLEQLLPEYPDQLVMGMDMAKKAYWKSYGGSPGLNYLMETIPDFLKSKELEAYLQKFFFENPKRLYSFFEPAKGS